MKSKKLIGALVAVVMSTSLAAGLSACATKGHTHSWQWKDIGGGEHRQECSCGETGETKPHTEGGDVCEDCGASLSTQVTVTDVTLDQTSAKMTVGGETLTLTATVTPAGAAQVSWESSDPSVATVSNGVVTALKAGTTTITARAGSKSATCTVTVDAAAVELTEEQWEQALNLSGKVGVVQTVTGGEVNRRTIAKLDGGKTYLKINEDDFSMEMYIEKTETKNYVYSRCYEYWSKAELTDQELEGYGIQENFDSGKDFYPFDKFDKGTADGEYVSKASYTVEQTDSDGEPYTMNIKEAKIKFSDEGKAVYAEYVNVENGVEYTNTMDLTYGETIVLPEVLEGEKVTPEEMTAALAMTDTNYRMALAAYGSVVVYEYQQSGTDKKMDISAYFSDNTEKEEIYFAKEENKFYRYNGKYGHWSKTELDGMTDQIYGSEITALGYIGINLSAYPVQAFTYNEQAKAYVLAGDGTTVIATFKNKKLVRVISAEGLNMSVIEFVYGDAQVTLPTIPAGEQLTDEEWATAQALNFDNVEVYEIGESGSATYKKDGDTVYRKVTGPGASEFYAVKDGDNYYAYSVEHGVWKKEEIEKSDYDSLNMALIFDGADKSGFTWDAASGTYTGTWGITQAAIKFVDKKIDTVISEYGQIYVNYGTAKITLPVEGSPAGGGGIIIDPEPIKKDITEEEWQQFFEDVQNSEALSVSFNSEDSHVSYTFDGENGYIFYSSNSEDYVYAEDNGKVWKYEYDSEQDRVSKTQTGYDSLDEVREELFGRFFEGENGASLKDMYDDFSGTNGNYGYRVSDSENWSVYVREGKLGSIGYYTQDSYQSYYFEQEIRNEPHWYVEYEGRIATEAEWETAFGMDYDRYHVFGISSSFHMYKDGDNYRIVNDGEDNYYGIENGTYFHYGYDEQTGSSTKEEISAAAFNTATQLLNSYDYADFELAEDEYGRAYYKNADDSVQIVFWKNRLERIVSEDSELIYEYDCGELFMPQDKLTEEEWTAAINEAFEADCLKYEMPTYAVYVDKNAGIIYVRGYSEVDNELYVLEDGELKKCVRNEQGDGYIAQSTDQTFEGLLDWLKAQVLEPDEVLNGENVVESYEHFEHNGLGLYTYVFDTETNSYIKVQFKGGKLWSASAIYAEEESGQIINANYFVEECEAEDVERQLPYWYVNGLNKDKDKD